MSHIVILIVGFILGAIVCAGFLIWAASENPPRKYDDWGRPDDRL